MLRKFFYERIRRGAVGKNSFAGSALAEPSVAAKLIYDLLRDLGSLQRLSEAREQALKSIQLLALSLARRSIHAREWDAANKATDAWYESALN